MGQQSSQIYRNLVPHPGCPTSGRGTRFLLEQLGKMYKHSDLSLFISMKMIFLLIPAGKNQINLHPFRDGFLFPVRSVSVGGASPITAQINSAL